MNMMMTMMTMTTMMMTTMTTMILMMVVMMRVRLMQVGLLKFSDRVDLSFHLSTYDNVDDVVEAIERLHIAGGDTNIALALRTARNQMFFARRGTSYGPIPRLLILVTDGKATQEEWATIIEANRTKKAGIRIFTVGIGRDIDERQLKAIATAPWEVHYFFVSDFGALQSVVQSVLDRSCAASATLATVRADIPVTTSTIAATTTVPAPATTSRTTTTTGSPTPSWSISTLKSMATSAASSVTSPTTTTTTTTTSTTTTKPTTTSSETVCLTHSPSLETTTLAPDGKHAYSHIFYCCTFLLCDVT